LRPGRLNHAGHRSVWIGGARGRRDVQGKSEDEHDSESGQALVAHGPVLLLGDDGQQVFRCPSIHHLLLWSALSTRVVQLVVGQDACDIRRSIA